MNNPVDIWTIYHVLGWFVATYIALVATFGKSLVIRLNSKIAFRDWVKAAEQYGSFPTLEIKIPAWQVVTALAMVCGFGWEICEWVWVEPALGFKEPWFNRWVSDPGSDALGILAALYIRARVIIAKALTNV